MMKLLELDGARGGGQLLRSALTLSLITGIPFRMQNIRGARKPKPGLMRQHLACVKAASLIGEAVTEGAELGSSTLLFAPQALKGGSFSIPIGSGGSTSLLMQMAVPALLHSSEPSQLEVLGGTHNPMAPPANFLAQSYFPALRKMGAMVDFHLHQVGFMQVGGGRVSAQVTPLKKWRSIHLLERTGKPKFKALLIHAHMPSSTLRHFHDLACRALSPYVDQVELCQVQESEGPGASLNFTILDESGIDSCFTCVAEFGRSSESLLKSLVKSIQDHLGSSAIVNRWLADQLLLPMSLAGEGSFITHYETKHLLSSMELIPKFLPIRWISERTEEGGLLVKVES